MAKTIEDLFHDEIGGSHDHLPVPSGSNVTFTSLYENMHGHLNALFEVDDPDSPWNGYGVSVIPNYMGISVVDLSFSIRFDSHEEHLAFQTAVLAYQQERTADAQQRTAIAQENTVKVLDKIALRLRDMDNLL